MNIKNGFKKVGSAVNRGWKKAVAVGSGVVASGSALAVDHSTAIAAAAADGVTNTTAAVTGVLTIVAVMVGVGLVIGFMRRS